MEIIITDLSRILLISEEVLVYLRLNIDFSCFINNNSFSVDFWVSHPNKKTLKLSPNFLNAYNLYESYP
jgi:hypothetical protein